MLQDRYGLALSTSSEKAAALYIDGVDRMLAADAGVEATLTNTINEDPQFALAHAALARYHQMRGRSKLARRAIVEAETLVANASTRERQHVAILQLLINGDMQGSLTLTHEHLRDYPRDAFALDPACGVFGSIGFSGRTNREDEQLALLEPLVGHYGNDWWFNTVYAFALLETGQYLRATSLVERALSIRPRSAHAAHTKMHALFEVGDDIAARDFLAGWLPASERGSLLHCHIWWHYALTLMATDDQSAAFTALCDNCLPGATDSPSINVFTDCVSFLWRAELAGAPRNLALWETLRSYYDEQFHRPIVFVDAHVGLVYAALGDRERLDECIRELQALGEANKLPAGTTAATLTRGYKAFVSGAWDDAIALLEPTLNELVRIGGSRAQRDLQVNTLLAAYSRAGRVEDANALLAHTADRQPARPIEGFST